MPATAIFIRTFFSICAHRENWIASSKPEPRRCALASSSAAASPASTASALEKKAYIGLLFNEADLEAMARVREAFDPDGRFNPAKLFPTPASCGEMRLAAGEYSGGVVDLINTGFEFRVRV